MKLKRCNVCGAVTACPAREYLEVSDISPKDVQFDSFGVPLRAINQPSGWEIDLIGSLQRDRVRSHWPMSKWTWVRQCTYALFVKRKPYQ